MVLNHLETPEVEWGSKFNSGLVITTLDLQVVSIIWTVAQISKTVTGG